MRLLREGMRAGDLINLVLPTLSVDEYVSKVDPDNAVVIGFYVHDQDAAKDLNRFMQKSAVDLLDTEVSPAPDQHGYYIVFVEFMNDDQIGTEMESLLHDVSALTSNETWKLRVRGQNDKTSFTPQALRKALDAPDTDGDLDESRAVLAYLRGSALCDVRLHDGLITLESGGLEYRFEKPVFLHKDSAFEHLAETAIPGMANLRETVLCSHLTRALGAGWTVTSVGPRIVFEDVSQEFALLLQVWTSKPL